MVSQEQTKEQDALGDERVADRVTHKIIYLIQGIISVYIKFYTEVSYPCPWLLPRRFEKVTLFISRKNALKMGMKILVVHKKLFR